MDTIEIGTYPQEGNGTRTPIEWIILERRGSQALLISKYALDCQPYNTTCTDVTWETCTLRRWLNETFLNIAFSIEEITRIETTSVSVDANPKHSTNPGNTTIDKVFLLSITEAETYFKSNDARPCKPTAYAEGKGAYTHNNGKCYWWFRSPGCNQNHAALAKSDGYVSYYGDSVDDGYYAVRPAMWVTIDLSQPGSIVDGEGITSIEKDLELLELIKKYCLITPVDVSKEVYERIATLWENDDRIQQL